MREYLNLTCVISTWMPYGFATRVVTDFSKNSRKIFGRIPKLFLRKSYNPISHYKKNYWWDVAWICLLLRTTWQFYTPVVDAVCYCYHCYDTKSTLLSWETTYLITASDTRNLWRICGLTADWISDDPSTPAGIHWASTGQLLQRQAGRLCKLLIAREQAWVK